MPRTRLSACAAIQRAAQQENALLMLAGDPPGGYTRSVIGWFCGPMHAVSIRRMPCNAEVLS